MKKQIMSEEAFWILIDDFETVEKLTPYGRRSIKHYVLEMRNKIEDLEGELGKLQDEFDDYKRRQENDYDPEIEIPQIHGKGISW